jgi:hypothetical protein
VASQLRAFPGRHPIGTPCTTGRRSAIPATPRDRTQITPLFTLTSVVLHILKAAQADVRYGTGLLAITLRDRMGTAMLLWLGPGYSPCVPERPVTW